MANSFSKYLIVGGVSASLLSLIVSSNAKVSSYNHVAKVEANTPLPAFDTITKPKKDEPPVKLRYDFKEDPTNNPVTNPSTGGLLLNDPANVKTKVEYNPTTDQYTIDQKIGNQNYRPPTYIGSDEYKDYMFKKQVKDYWSSRVHADSPNSQSKPIIPKLNVGGEIFDRIFGGNTVDIKPTGSAELIFAYNGTNTENPSIPQKNRKIHTFNFDEKIQLNVVGKIGDKLKLTTSYNTQATFDFENQMKIGFTGYDDDIIKSIEAGNVSMPSVGSLITGSQTLFGVKAKLQFGRLMITSVAAKQNGKKSEIESSGGAQLSKFEIAGDAYEQNKHFFLAHYFRDQYNTALEHLPFVNSGVNINRVEVWVSNTNTSTTDIRSLVAFADLAEDIKHVPKNQQLVGGGYLIDTAGVLPFNSQNNLYGLIQKDTNVRAVSRTVTALGFISAKIQQQQNFELVSSARKLQASEYTLNSRLGYISLNRQLNPDQTLSVSYQYTLDGKTYQVGEFSDGGISAPQALYTKMLKSTIINTKQSFWPLMMKNVYSIGAYQVNAQNFKCDIFYTNRATGTDINYLPVSDCQSKIKSKPLIQVMALDRVNQQNEPAPDGLFDFIDGVTVNASNGLIIFPVTEPFGSYLHTKFDSTCSPIEYATYLYSQLYDSTKIFAQQYFPQYNRFKLKGTYQSSSSSEIMLGAPNVPQGSVTVTAGGVKLTENVDYTVDYALGRVKIINDGVLNSGAPVKIALESNSLFQMQTKRLLATHLDYTINKDFTVGGTIMNLTERPLTKKVNIGDEPVSNTIFGLNGNYKTEAPFLTRLVDKIPFIDTKEGSTITAVGEVAYLMPGHNKAIGKSGTSYIDDFEGSQSTIDLRSQSAWVLASTPQGQASLFPEANTESLANGFNRAKLAWYVMSPEFIRKTPNVTPPNITDKVMSNNFTREVLETEVFPNKQLPNGVPTNISTFDMAYYPTERGPYNFDVLLTNISRGLDVDGSLKSPTSRWAGIMRSLQTTDFETSNISYIQFWVMDPFNSDNPNPNKTGDLYFNLGNVSEDILKDGQKSSENGLPAPNSPQLTTIPSVWGRVPGVQPLLNVFSSNPEDRPFQDVGFDGLSSRGYNYGSSPTEQIFHKTYLDSIRTFLTPAAYAQIQADPSADDFHYFRGSDYDSAQFNTLERYKKFNGMENNSRTSTQSPESYPTASSLIPNVEDINQDNNLSTVEGYYQYHISLDSNNFKIGKNYITNVYQTLGANIKDQTSKPIKWYQFKIPIKSPESKVGTIDNFQSIRFFRMFYKNVDKPIVMRFARLELVRGEWRKYDFDLSAPGIYNPDDNPTTNFDIAAVNLEENGSKTPVNYVLPPNITRQVNASSANLLALNEQSISLSVCDLQDGAAKAAFKNTSLDVRSYKKMQMFIHAEAPANTAQPLKNNDLHAFVRLGTDYTDNYYEYDIPLAVSAPGFYNGTNVDDQYKVWPEANDMILEFAKLEAAKLQRNSSIGKGSATEFTSMDGNRKIIIKGNPNLAAIKTIMIGVRNPKKNAADGSDDGLDKCGQVWVDELRLTDFNQSGGGAATGSVTAKLADFGAVSVSGNMYTPGFGTVENKVSQLKRETLKQYYLTSNFQLGKFLPDNANINLPMYAAYSQSFITPKYNPMDPDMLLADALKDPTLSKAQKDSIKKATQDYTEQKSINFTNVKKNKGKNSGKSHIYDIENLTATYAYTSTFKRNTTIEYSSLINKKGELIYSFSPTAKNYTPFAKIVFLQSKYLTLIKDFNFFLVPSNLGFSTNVERNFNVAKYRDVTPGMLEIQPTFNKRINWDRNYNFGYSLTKALKFDFTATNNARVLEPGGFINTQQKKDSILRNFKDLGVTTQYNHQMNANYTIPVNKLPFLDFTKASVKYTATYNWLRSPVFDTQKGAKDTLGNTIQNSRVIAWTGELNMITLYNKIPYFKKLSQKGNKRTPPKANNPIDLKNKNATPAKDTTKKNYTKVPVEIIMRILTGLKNVSGTYSMNDGTILNGYNLKTNALGMDKQFAGPTPGFIFGSQKDIREQAINNSVGPDTAKHWLIHRQSLNTPYTTTSSQTINIRANVEPLPDVKVGLTAVHTQSHSNNEFFRWNRAKASYVHDSPIETGTFSMSFSTFRTSFKNGDDTFTKFLAARTIISDRLSLLNPLSAGRSKIDDFAEGYNKTSQDVLIPAFLATYSGNNPNKVGLTAFPKIPKPNWNITYDGLSKIDFFKKWFKTVTLSHAYKSTYNVGSYTSNMLFVPDSKDGFSTVREQVSTISNNTNFYAEKLITTATILEQWSPLMKIDVVLHNTISVNAEFKKDRNLSLGLTSKTITEVTGREIVVGTGYRIKNVSLGNTIQIKGKPIKSDLNLKADLSFRKNSTNMRRIEEGSSQLTAGSNIISIKFSADYVINERFNIRFFYDRIINKPVTSNSFATTNTNAGLSLRLSLSN